MDENVMAAPQDALRSKLSQKAPLGAKASRKALGDISNNSTLKGKPSAAENAAGKKTGRKALGDISNEQPRKALGDISNKPEAKPLKPKAELKPDAWSAPIEGFASTLPLAYLGEPVSEGPHFARLSVSSAPLSELGELGMDLDLDVDLDAPLQLPVVEDPLRVESLAPRVAPLEYDGWAELGHIAPDSGIIKLMDMEDPVFELEELPPLSDLGEGLLSCW